MTQEERRCLLLADKYWSGYLLGIGGTQQHSQPSQKTGRVFAHHRDSADIVVGRTATFGGKRPINLTPFPEPVHREIGG